MCLVFHLFCEVQTSASNDNDSFPSFLHSFKANVTCGIIYDFPSARPFFVYMQDFLQGGAHYLHVK